MSFDLEGILDSPKDKVVEAATEKFGSSATPIAEDVADKMEEVFTEKMGVQLHGENRSRGHGYRKVTFRVRNSHQTGTLGVGPVTRKTRACFCKRAGLLNGLNQPVPGERHPNG
jgi:hypothetical protein